MASHSRTHSTLPAVNPPHRTYHSSSPFHNQRPGTSRDTAYNGSEGFIDDIQPSTFDRNGNGDIRLAAPAQAVTPPRPALGARLLSSLSNAQPAASALSRKGSVLHSRARSLAGFVPKLNTSSSPTPDRSEKSERVKAPNKIFGDLFNGESAPIRIGAPVSPTKEKEESEFIMDYRPNFTERPSAILRRRGTGDSAASTTPTQKSSWFSRKPTFSSASKQTQDELATLNINVSLFPNGPTDPLNPAAFNDLLLNATNLLQRMQVAYKEKIDYIASIKPEIDAQREEVEEAETRSKHLKMQLEEMGRQSQQQETAMQEMALQLAEEKMKVQEAQEAARTVRLVRRSDSREGDEEETPTRRRKRGSAGSASDSGFESDVDSVFSGNNSGAETPISPPSISASSMAGYDGKSWNLRQQKRSEGQPGRSGNNNAGKRLGSEGAAWATVETLRSENQDLKVQMEEMQKTLQGCIDFVSAVTGV